MEIRKRNSKSFIVGLASAAAASLCCIAPVIAIVAGAGGLASSFSWIEPYRPYLIGCTVILFAFAWYQKLKSDKESNCHCEIKEKGSFFNSKRFLGITTTAAILLITFPYYSKAVYKNVAPVQKVSGNSNEIKSAVFLIKGMTCEGCTEHVNSAVTKLNGIKSIQTSFESGNSIVAFDVKKVNVDSIKAAINSTGYTVVDYKGIKN